MTAIHSSVRNREHKTRAFKAVQTARVTHPGIMGNMDGTRRSFAVIRNTTALLMAAALAGSISSTIYVTSAVAQPQAGLCEREMMRASSLYGVPLGMLYSVGLTETGKRGSLQPYAMNVEGKAVFSNSMAEAIQKFEQVSRSG